MKIKIHTCIGQEKVAYGLLEPGPRKCTCKKTTTLRKATRMVEWGEASWTVATRTRGERMEPCRMCFGDEGVQNCALCQGKGETLVPFVEDTPGNDIILISRATLDEKKRSSAFKQMTPRVATIEEEHIERAYVDENRAAQLRIEEYGRLILEARMFVGPNRIPVIVPEPADDRSTGTGRTYDYGRTI